MSRKRRKRLKRERRRERREQKRQRKLRLRTQSSNKGNRKNRPNKSKNNQVKISGYKNKKQYKKDKKKWKNSRLQAKNPAGYESFLEKEKAFKNQNKQTPVESEARKEKDDKKDWELEGKELRSHESNIAATDKAAANLRNYKPKEIKGLKRNKYTNDLPKRPGFPKLPKITTPGGDLKVTRVDRPSGLTNVKGFKRDQDNRYNSPNSDYSNVYTNLKPSTASRGKVKTKTVKPIKPKTISGGPKQVSRNPIKRK